MHFIDKFIHKFNILLSGSIMKKEFTMVIEQDEDGIYVASVPELEGCHTQAKTLDELRERMREAIELYLEVESDRIHEMPLNFVGIQTGEQHSSRCIRVRIL
jgi:predicted RNase H-like HicB family nuclease